jgi:DNA-binding transcriptional ArsR family regulator
MEKSTHFLTPSSLKALAHPIRVQLLGLLRLEGPSTATALAARIGESSGTTSYHLRQLAAADFVVEDSERGNARDRWWKAAQESTRLEPNQLDNDPDTQVAVDAYMLQVARMSWRRLEHWLQTSRAWPKKWQDATTLSDWSLSLSPKELLALGEEIEKVIEGYRRDPKKGDERVAVQWQTFPERSIAL